MHFTAIPHYLTEDDEYNGHLIPGGSVVLGNVWFANLPMAL